MDKKTIISPDRWTDLGEAMREAVGKKKPRRVIPPRGKKTDTPPAKEKHEAFTVLLRPDQAKRLKVLAVERGVTVSRLMRDVIDGKTKI
ncbi:MAG: hypothetical protein A2Z06_01305 [Candidatus Glassbacteria bacterium RBG_16_58_8]|uniref:Uncharacterized protein n=1 Tax=Candidatus Glassbacteria bacterium RBG_16_58_8 TaxID=1817866 RepID=A0A1F5YC85_9BACT|nr:MAG: hypothetical protein A2Z06_01305 [Candidatus Glassbacteria bacterium RBG_16_58_8]